MQNLYEILPNEYGLTDGKKIRDNTDNKLFGIVPINARICRQSDFTAPVLSDRKPQIRVGTKVDLFAVSLYSF